MIALIYDAEGRFYASQSSMSADAATYLASEMARKGFTDYALVGDDVDMNESYFDAVSGTVQPRPLIAARTPGALPWTIPQAEGETVTVRNEGGDIVESDDHTDPVTITDAGTYAITVSAAFPAITWRGSVDLA